MGHTVCIAASCSIKGYKQAAILCSDAAIEIDGSAVGEVPYKAMGIGVDMSAMFSGNVSRATELIRRYQTYFNHNKLTDTWKDHEDFLDILRIPLRDQNRIEFEDYLSATCGMQYAEFIALGEQERRSLIYDWSRDAPSRDIIIAWAYRRAWRFFEIGREPHEESRFATIGSGGATAKASLLARGYESDLSLREAIYYVYEAKKRSEIVPGVGRRTYLTVLVYNSDNPQTTFHPFSVNSFKRLDEQYAAFGGKPFDASVAPLTNMESLVSEQVN